MPMPGDWPPKPFAAHSDYPLRRYGPHRGPMVYLVVRQNGTPLGWSETRAAATAALTKRVATLDGADEYEIRYVPRGSVPEADLRWGEL